MSSTIFPEIKDATLALLCDRILGATRNGQGTAYSGLQDRLGNTIAANSQVSGGQASTTSQAGPGREVEIVIRINPDGLTATTKIVAQTPVGVQAIVGALDPSLLAAHIS